MVAIVGRPNVGKSTLFNRIVGERIAIVEDVPGTTRDRIYATAEWRGREFSLIDTGGLADPGAKGARRADDTSAGEMEAAVRRQAEAAIAEADLVLFVVDAKSGILPVEHDVADLLRRSGKPVILVANKADSWRGEAQAAEFYELGLGEVLAVSAIQGLGTGDLLDVVVERLPEAEAEEEARDPRVAIVGRPNVGKSSFLNALVGSERAVVSEIPGTTRDSVDTAVELDGRRVVLVDTAGIRRRGRVEEGIEKYALLRTAHALERADVAVLIIDATEGITAQDVHIAGYALDARVGLVLAVNKWDVVDRGADMTASVEADIAREFHFVPWMGHHFVSAKTGRNVKAALADALAVVDERARRVPTAELHRMLVDVVAAHPPASHRGKEVRFTHVTQARGKAPTFVFFVDPPEGVHFTYLRYLENAIRDRFGFRGTPIVIEFKRAYE
jgi:GTP-binding protein